VGGEETISDLNPTVRNHLKVRKRRNQETKNEN
jgi:hypothetical protein